MNPRDQAVALWRAGVPRRDIMAQTGLTGAQVSGAIFKARNPGYTTAYARKTGHERKATLIRGGHGWHASKLIERWEDRKARRAVTREATVGC